MSPIPSTMGRYRIQGELGRGGMGVVLLGIDPQLEREVAIKVLDVRQLVSEEARARFLREARALADSVLAEDPNLTGPYRALRSLVQHRSDADPHPGAS